MLAYAIEINAQLLTALVFFGTGLGAIAFTAWKKFGKLKEETRGAQENLLVTTVDVQTDVARAYKDLFEVEKLRHAQTKEQLTNLAARVKTLEEEHGGVIALNVKHQETIRQMGHTINNLRQRLENSKIAHDDIK